MIPFLMYAALGKKVLIWDDDYDPDVTSPGDLADAAAAYSGLATVHTSATYSGTLSDYSLIIWLVAASDPVWWSEISGDTWEGRLVITSEAQTGGGAFTDTYAYVNALSGLMGITVNGDSIDFPGTFSLVDGTVTGDALMSGQSVLKYWATASVSGGTTLATTVTGSSPFIARNRPGVVEFVACGDSNPFVANAIGDAVTANTTFLRNLYTVPLM